MQALMRVVLFACLPWLASVAVAGQPVPASAPAPAHVVPRPSVIMAPPGITLEQAVAEVQQRTHGKVLSAASRQYGNATEYRIKILTSDGHVRVVPVRSRPSRNPQHKPEETH